MSYLKLDEKTLENFDSDTITNNYSKGYVFTRVAKGNMIQTRSLRVKLSEFELTSENRRILNKNSNLEIQASKLPMENYSWEVHAMGKEFYTKKFGDGTMSAAKIKEMFTDTFKSNMNSALVYRYSTMSPNPVGYALCYLNDEIIHYAYPFYVLEIPREQSLGMAMMIKAISWAKQNGLKYIYLGSVVEPSSKYKLQFSSLEWYDPEINEWSSDINKLKTLIF